VYAIRHGLVQPDSVRQRQGHVTER
jgi:hypothetical protein